MFSPCEYRYVSKADNLSLSMFYVIFGICMHLWPYSARLVHMNNKELKVTCFIEYGNLIALYLGKLRVVHFLSFDKSYLKRPSMLPQLALSNFYQSWTYELNPGS